MKVVSVIVRILVSDVMMFNGQYGFYISLYNKVKKLTGYSAFPACHFNFFYKCDNKDARIRWDED